MTQNTLNISSGNSTGLSNDALILKQALNQCLPDLKVRHFSGAKSKLSNALLLLQLACDKYILRQKQYTLHLEELYTEVMRFSDTNILIPNQEWLRSGTQNLINPDIVLWCKTHYACQQLSSLSENINYLGFSSFDRMDTNISRDAQKYLHVAGKSAQKGTLPLLQLWASHPEWPLLQVISRRAEHQVFKRENIVIISDFISTQQLSEIMNTSVFHLCPSESEGFGHNIVEALSVGAIVLTTNAAPMNELVLPEFGFLVQWQSKTKQYFSEMHVIDNEHLEQTIIKMLQISEHHRQLMQNKSREHYLYMAHNFNNNINTQIKELFAL